MAPPHKSKLALEPVLPWSACPLGGRLEQPTLVGSMATLCCHFGARGRPCMDPHGMNTMARCFWLPPMRGRSSRPWVGTKEHGLQGRCCHRHRPTCLPEDLISSVKGGGGMAQLSGRWGRQKPLDWPDSYRNAFLPNQLYCRATHTRQSSTK